MSNPLHESKLNVHNLTNMSLTLRRLTPSRQGATTPKDPPGSDTPFYHEHALLSAAAYNLKKYESRYKSLGYDMDHDLSQKNRTVFYNKSKGRAVIAYKGTDPSHVSDLISDGQIVNGWHRI